MTAIYKHELKSFYTNIIAYAFAALILLFIGIYFMVYNLRSAVPMFEYVFGAGCIVYFVAIPILTMRVFAEEKKQKTDQLLYSLPLPMTKVVLGKYLAMLTVLAAPLAVSCIYPLLLRPYGNINMKQAYLTILAFFLMGAAFTAIGMFLSSLTENQAIAAGMCFAVILINYFLNTFASYIDTTARSSFLAFSVLAAALVAIVWAMTKNSVAGLASGAVLEVILAVLYKTDSTRFEGLFPNFFGKLSLFQRFFTIVNGMFDLTAIIFYLSLVAVFIFLTVQSLEKRRWS